MASSLCVLLTRGPYGTLQAAEALRHISGALTYDLKTTALFLGDGVYAAKRGQRAGEAGWTSLSQVLEKMVAAGQGALGAGEHHAAFCAHGPSLTARGLSPAHLVAGVEVIGDEELGRLLGQAEKLLVF